VKTMSEKTYSPAVYDRKNVKVVQGGADTFKEESITTNADFERHKCFLVRGIEVSPSDANLLALLIEAAAYCKVQFTAKSVAAALDKDDKDYIDEIVLPSVGGATAAGMAVLPPFPLRLWKDIVVWTEKLYINVTSSGGLTWTIYVRVLYENAIVNDPKKILRGWN